MMTQVDEKHLVVDRSTGFEVAGVLSADLEASQAMVKRRNADGEEEQVTLYSPAGIAIVSRR